MKTLLILFLLFLFVRLYAPPFNIENSEYVFDTMKRYDLSWKVERLWEATCYVESSCNPLSVNQDEQAYGIAQIRQIRLDDYFKRTGINYTLYDMFDVEKSREIYMYYATADLERTAKRWNGSGRMTEEYWKKIQKRLRI